MSATCIAPPRVLIADDQADLLDALRLLLKGEGMQMEAVTSPDAALDALTSAPYDLLLMDLNYTGDTTSGTEGMDLLSRVQEIDNSLPVVVMTGWGSVDLAVETMRRGVRDFVQKPWENSGLLRKLRTQIEQGRARRVEQNREQQLKIELHEAREIQRGLMPRKMPNLAGFSLASAWQAARDVSGDYLAAFRLNESHAALCIADVAGKGFPAALLMSNMQAALKSFASEKTSPSELCEKLNQLMCSNTPLRKFISCFYGELDVPNRTLTFTNAGHNPPILMRRKGECIHLEDGGRVIGAFCDSSYTQSQIKFYEGDKLLLFTDGVTEARSATGEEFGDERLQKCLRAYRGRSAAELRTTILNEVTQFCGDNFDDDAALMVVIAE